MINKQITTTIYTVVPYSPGSTQPIVIVFYSPLSGFSLLAHEVIWSHTETRHSR